MPPESLSKAVVPVRYSAWLGGDLGQILQGTLQDFLRPLPRVTVTPAVRGFVVEAAVTPAALLEAVHPAVLALEDAVVKAFPVFYQEFGPVWTGSISVILKPD